MLFSKRLTVAATLFLILLGCAALCAETRDDLSRLHQQGALLFRDSKYEEALDSWLKGLEISERLNDKMMRALFLNDVGSAYSSLARYEKALDCYERSLKILQEIGDKKGEGISLSNIGYVYNYLGKYEKALHCYEQSLKILRESGDRCTEGVTLSNIGSAYSQMGEYKRAIEYQENSLRIAQELGDRKSEGISLNNLGLNHDYLGEYEKALQYYEKSLHIRQETGDRKGEGVCLNNIGSISRSRGEYDKALQYYEKSLKIRRETGDRQGEGVCLNSIGLVHEDRGEYEKAREYYEKSLRIRQEIGDRKGEGVSLSGIGSCYGNTGQFQKGLEYYEKSCRIAEDIGDKNGIAISFNNIGSVYNDLGQYERAIEYYEKSRTIAVEIGDRKLEGDALNNLGLTNNTLGEYERAIDLHEKALKIRQQIGDRKGEANSLNNMGHFYSGIGEYERALQYFEKSCRIAREIGSRKGEGDCLNNIGSIHDRIGFTCDKIDESKKALAYYNDSLKIAQEIGDAMGESITRNNIGNIYYILLCVHRDLDFYRAHIEDYKNSRQYYEELLKRQEKMGDRRGTADSHNQIGRTLLSIGSCDEALTHSKKSLEIYDEIHDLDGSFLSLENMGIAYEGLNQEDNAISCYTRSIEVLEMIRGRLTLEEHRSGFMKTRMNVYERLIRLLIKRGKREEAWNYTERARARSFLDMLGNHRIQFRAKADPRLVKQEEELEDGITAARALLEKEENPERRKESYSRVVTLQNEYEETLEKLKRSCPEYASLKAARVASLKEVQDSLAPDEIILDYFTALQVCWLFVIERDSLEVIEIPLAEKVLRSQISALRKEIATRASTDEAVNSLSRALVPDIVIEHLKGKKQILFVPHSSLHYLPFGVLMDSKGEYLAEKFELLTEPSCSVWKLCREKKKKAGASLAAYALGDMKMSFTEGKPVRGTVALDPELLRGGFSPLPGTREEVEEIGRLFKDEVILIGGDMKIERVQETIKGKSLVHFATHGILDAQRPLFSGLLFSDGILTTADIFGLECSPDLVVLSACNSAGGRLVKGDELEGLSRAFMLAGASAVMASLWSVSDESTAKLMKIFYQELSKGESAGAALKTAQLKIREEYGHPFYWAPFIISGD